MEKQARYGIYLWSGLINGPNRGQWLSINEARRSVTKILSNRRFCACLEDHLTDLCTLRYLSLDENTNKTIVGRGALAARL